MRNFVFAGALVLAGSVGAQAADLVVNAAPAAVDTSLVNSSIYVQLLGGVVQGLDVTYFRDGADDGSWPTKMGYSFAATVGVVVIDGLSLEADVLHSSRQLDDPDEVTYSTTSLMGNIKYTLGINDMFSVYGAAGLGYVWGNETWNSGSQDYESFGYQLIAGVEARFTDNISGVLEYRFQDTFDKSNYVGPEDRGLSIPVSTVLAGLKLSF